MLTKKCEKLERNYKDQSSRMNKFNDLLDRFETWNKQREKDEGKKDFEKEEEDEKEKKRLLIQ